MVIYPRRERQACRHSHSSPESISGRPPLQSRPRLSRCRDPRSSRPPLGSQELSLLRCQGMAEGNRLPSLENAPHLKTDGEFFVYQHYSVTTILQVVTPISILKNVILGSSLQYRFSKITPSLFVDKASCTRQFESELSLHSLASLFPIKKGVFSNPSVSLSKGSSTSNQAFLLRRKDVTALRCSEPLRSKVGGPSKVFAMFCGMGPPGDNLL